ncbi:hypothetical protein [Mesorhizobium sp. M4B.F.Ca.ET.049.02.1.2]|uniref:hypothetical protein n=1 Tax=Mesorhizobium sp. M4B.F.Ca.ET.049.02.1.2 TaxID=2496752 RepID=UPI000FCC37A4|nr:hypothetical protein [Mesorhizobium sp. M4B.F.Ca.ET.049.02.1.2]RUW72124.1 hypothetical protein EOA31_16340 [Mesorhizobium sp. M4B.F.Ca.ET.049.02.1.2]
MKKIASVSKSGVYLPEEIAFLRRVVRESLQACSADKDERQAEIIARRTLDAYRHGVVDRKMPVEIARTRILLETQASDARG